MQLCGWKIGQGLFRTGPEPMPLNFLESTTPNREHNNARGHVAPRSLNNMSWNSWQSQTSPQWGQKYNETRHTNASSFSGMQGYSSSSFDDPLQGTIRHSTSNPWIRQNTPSGFPASTVSHNPHPNSLGLPLGQTGDQRGPLLGNESRGQAALQQSYKALLQENMELRRVLQTEYQPLKHKYRKLKEEQQDREYLISQLQWKVKELASNLRNHKF